MRFSDVVKDMPGTLVRDADFSCIAFASESSQVDFLTFLDRERFLSALESPNISCVLTTEALCGRIPAHIRGVFVCSRPKAALFAIHNQLSADGRYVPPPVDTRIGHDCSISPLAYVDPHNIVIGNHVTIDPFAYIKGRVKIGDYARIGAGAIIGAKGFSFTRNEDGLNIPVIDTAQIIIEDHVEIFEQVVISIGIFPWEKTVIGKNTKVDTQAFIAHGCHVGQNCLIVAGVRCCGNCHIGDNVWLGANATISNRISIGDNARVSLGAVVTKDVLSGETVSGNFAIEHRRFLDHIRKLSASREHIEQNCPPPADNSSRIAYKRHHTSLSGHALIREAA